MSTITIGVDLAKSTFSSCETDAAGHVLRRQEFKRDAFAHWLAQLPAGTLLAMEACSGASPLPTNTRAKSGPCWRTASTTTRARVCSIRCTDTPMRPTRTEERY